MEAARGSRRRGPEVPLKSTVVAEQSHDCLGPAIGPGDASLVGGSPALQ